MTTVRPECPDDFAAVYEINAQAFGQPNEAQLVDALRRVADPYISLVAEREGHVVGHIFFSPVSVVAEDTAWPAITLAPVAVRPGVQRTGIGGMLVRAGLTACAELGHPVVFVLGHPTYYPRFGFRPAADFGIGCEFPAPAEAFMVAEAEPGALAGRTGVVHFLPEFQGV